MSVNSKPRYRVKNGEVLRPKASGAYEAATQGRRATNWSAPNVGPVSALSRELVTLRNRSRAAFRNNPWLERAIARNVSNEVGTGIVPVFDSSNAEFNEAMEPLWLTWTGQSSADGSLDFYGQLSQIVRTRRVSGECLARIRYRSDALGLAVPMQLEILEPDYLPLDYNRTLRNGNRVVSGKEYDRRGILVAFWLHREHPADSIRWGQDSTSLIRVPARQVIHHYQPTRPGQVRGEPDAATALLRAKHYDSYEDAELIRKETRAPFTGFLKKDYTGETDWSFDPITGEELSGDAIPDVTAKAGTIITGALGESLELFKGDDTGQGYSDFQRQQLLAIAAGTKVPYELLTGDWSKINDRVYRALIGEYRREIEACQDHLTIHQVCERVGKWFTDHAVLTGRVSAPGYAMNADDYNKRDWRPQRWPHINPLQDVEATIAEMGADLDSLDSAVARRGYRAADIQRQNVEARKRRRDLETEAGLDPVENEGSNNGMV